MITKSYFQEIIRTKVYIFYQFEFLELIKFWIQIQNSVYI